jgi:hypothetical protein
MAKENAFALPELPQLLGEENLEEWKAAIYDHFEWHGILQYLTDDVPEPPVDNIIEHKAWKRARLKGKITMCSSLTNKNVRDKLKNSGWNPIDDSDPKALYKLILQVIPSTSEEALSSLYAEFVTIDRAKYNSLAAFQTRITYLKNRLEALNCLPPERGNVIVVIKGLKTTYPDWHNFLMYDFEKEILTWKTLMEEISKRANHELIEMSLVTTKSETNTPTPSNTFQSQRSKKTYCSDCGFKHWPNNKWCEQCKQHEEDKWIWCFTCKKHHGYNYWKCKREHVEIW